MSATAMSAYPAEKGLDTLPTSLYAKPPPPPPRRRLSTGFCVLLTAICAGVALYAFAPQCAARHFGGSQQSAVDFKSDDLCPQPSPLVPSKSEELWKDLGEKYQSKEFLHAAVEWLGGAVRVPYVTHLLLELCCVLRMA